MKLFQLSTQVGPPIFAAAVAVVTAVTLSRPSVAAPNPTVPTYVMPIASSGGQPCTTPDIDAVKRVIQAKLAERALLIDDRLSPDPLGDVESRLAPGSAQPTIVATACKNGNVNLVTVNGYTVSAATASLSSGTSFGVKIGGSITGSLETLRAADWSALFAVTAFPNVAYLPIFGDNADIINGRLERELAITEVKTIDSKANLCKGSASKMLVDGQGSLAAANLDPLRAVLTASALSFSQPQPWGTIYKVGGAGVSLVGIPNTADIAVDVYYCDAAKLMQVGGNGHHIVGHARRLSVGTGAGTQRRVLDEALSDLQNQVDCIIERNLNERGLSNDPYDDVAASQWCIAYYAQVRRADADVTNRGPAKPQNTQ
ncbi:MAG TPA: hypothetical protein VGU66_16060 [Candidatus Elarobacter sp.]|nr:hypothetical protein [Candidatus Elarobacter sp.]